MTLITKTDAARRQLETALDLYFHGGDTLSSHTLAYAAFRILMDIYPHHNGDGFDDQLDALFGREGWRIFSQLPNFLKHADRDPLAAATAPRQLTFSVLGLACLLYRRVVGTFSLPMEAMDAWVESIGGEAMGIEEVDENHPRAAAYREANRALLEGPEDQMREAETQFFDFYLANRDRIVAAVGAASAAGLTVTELLDALPAPTANARE